MAESYFIIPGVRIKSMPEYHIWRQMKQRCTNPKNRSFHNYGGRGIFVSPKWLDSFRAFYADMGPRPSSKHSLDRANNDGPYSSDNCKWATGKKQHNNRRNNHRVTINGESLTIMEWAGRLGKSHLLIRSRLARGEDEVQSITSPKRHRIKGGGRPGAMWSD